MKSPVTPAEAADLIADKVFAWTKETGRPLVLSETDREEIAGIIARTQESASLAAFYDARNQGGETGD